MVIKLQFLPGSVPYNYVTTEFANNSPYARIGCQYILIQARAAIIHNKD